MRAKVINSDTVVTALEDALWRVQKAMFPSWSVQVNPSETSMHKDPSEHDKSVPVRKFKWKTTLDEGTSFKPSCSALRKNIHDIGWGVDGVTAALRSSSGSLGVFYLRTPLGTAVV